MIPFRFHRGNTYNAKVAAVLLRTYWSAEGKAIRFDNNPEECEKVWTMYNKMCELDKEKGKQVKEYEG